MSNSKNNDLLFRDQKGLLTPFITTHSEPIIEFLPPIDRTNWVYQRFMREKMKMTNNGKGLDNYRTPLYIFKQLDAIFNFTLDVACTIQNKMCPKGYCFDEGLDGLEAPWARERVFCNPPFSEKDKWIEKAHDEVQNNNCPICIMILPLNCMSMASFQKIIDIYYYDILEKRIFFINPETGRPQSGNNSGSVVVYFMKKPIVR